MPWNKDLKEPFSTLDLEHRKVPRQCFLSRIPLGEVNLFWNSVFLRFQRIRQMLNCHVKNNFMKRSIFPYPFLEVRLPP
jgi:hypothetical protein